MAKVISILTGRDADAIITELSSVTGLDTSNVSRRSDAAKQKTETDRKFAYAKTVIEKEYGAKIAESQA
ncbi:MAG: hypothetical protein WKF92_06150 [Pyrinomonadaceae bacterium]